MTNTPSSSKNVILFGIGVAAGWLMKQLFDSPEVKEKREEVMATVDEVRSRLEDSDQGARIKAIFGSTSRDVTKLYEKVKDQVVAELGDLKVSFSQIDKQKYQAIVTEIVKAAGKSEGLPTTQLEKLKAALINDFSKLQVTKKSRNKAGGKKLASTKA